MFILIVDIHIKPGSEEAFIRATEENSRNSVQEAGVARFDVVRDTSDPLHFSLVEVYRHEEALGLHKETAHFAVWNEVVEDMMAVPRTRVRYESIFPADEAW